MIPKENLRFFEIEINSEAVRKSAFRSTADLPRCLAVPAVIDPACGAGVLARVFCYASRNNRIGPQEEGCFPRK